MAIPLSPDAIGELIWAERYRAPELDESAPADSYARVARALAAVEPVAREAWAERFEALLVSGHFLPGGRILAGAGREQDSTLANCFVMGELEDSLEGIFAALRASALTLQAGGGIGLDFSPLRPAGTPATRSGRVASGPVSFAGLWNALSETLLAGNPRQGAMMGVLDCHHPDLPAFIAAKREPTMLQHFNLSILASDAFMTAVETGADWRLAHVGGNSLTRPAAELWQALVDANRVGGEPGLIFIDSMNRANRLNYCETLHATNPCGELPLPPHGACVLGSICLPKLVTEAFGARAGFDWNGLRDATRLAVRMLDNAVDLARLPLAEQRDRARQTRRIGLGITGLADTLLMLDLDYRSGQGRDLAVRIMRQLRDTAYAASCELAREKGAFPALDAERYLAQPGRVPLPDSVCRAIRNHGLRNSHLTAIAPAGSISLLAGNISSGIEPVPAWQQWRRIRLQDGPQELQLHNRAWELYRHNATARTKPGGVWVTADQIPVEAQLEMVAALQPLVDSGISKTLAMPSSAPASAYADAYRRAWQRGLKGLTCFPLDAARGRILDGAPHCTADEVC